MTEIGARLHAAASLGEPSRFPLPRASGSAYNPRMKNPHAVALGRLGGLKAGIRKVAPAKRRRNAQRAALVRAIRNNWTLSVESWKRAKALGLTS